MAYSSIAHMGFAMMGLAAGTLLGVQAMLIYMAIYVTMNVGTFAFILSMERDGQLMLNRRGAYGLVDKLNLLLHASRSFEWSLPLAEVARIWKAGCIIRARFLQKIAEAFRTVVMVLTDAEIQPILVSLLARGHVLIEGIPGTGKTLLAKAISLIATGRSPAIMTPPPSSYDWL